MLVNVPGNTQGRKYSWSNTGIGYSTPLMGTNRKCFKSGTAMNSGKFYTTQHWKLIIFMFYKL